MLPLKRILCPTDFSADSRAALRAAGEMALFFQAELTVLHVHVSPQPAVWPYEGLGVNPIEAGLSNEETLKLRRTELEGEAQAALPEELQPRLEILEGEPAEVILTQATQRQVDLIVLAPHGHNRLRTALFGSTAEKVVRQSPCPVMTLHAGQVARSVPGGLDSRKAKA
jgi:nucleotide-binding universal stress UspA family protein